MTGKTDGVTLSKHTTSARCDTCKEDREAHPAHAKQRLYLQYRKSARNSATERNLSRNGKSYEQNPTEEDIHMANEHLRRSMAALASFMPT